MANLVEIVVVVLIFLSFVLFIGEPDLHDAIVKWANTKVTGDQPCPTSLLKKQP